MIKNVAIIGAGQMGRGIARAALEAGFAVILVDAQQQQLDRAKAHERLRCTTDLSQVKVADLIIEAVSEEWGIKQEIFTALSRYKQPDTILASNTSSLSITKLASFTTTPAQVIGIHFMNPAHVISLVEVIRGAQTDELTFTQSCTWLKQLGKTVVVSQDRPGFIVNRLLIPMINEAICILQEGVAVTEDIDTAIRMVTGNPMGPLQTADLIGLDICLAVMQVLQHELGEEKYRPSPLLERYVATGWLGCKTGRGFYTYDQ